MLPKTLEKGGRGICFSRDAGPRRPQPDGPRSRPLAYIASVSQGTPPPVC
ncbi:hypothetical protein [Lysobacter gummosus]